VFEPWDKQFVMNQLIRHARQSAVWVLHWWQNKQFQQIPQTSLSSADADKLHRNMFAINFSFIFWPLNKPLAPVCLFTTHCVYKYFSCFL
jgi:hypothetical protein